MRDWVEAQVATGEYANASDFVRDLIRHNQREREAIILALIEGEQSGISSDSFDEIIAEAKAELRHE